jgi:regulator of sigma E protease
MFYPILSFALLNIVYLIAFFGISIWLKVTETEYYVGGSRKRIRFQIGRVTFHLGFYIPVFGPIYTLVDGQKRMKYPWEFQQYSIVRRLIATLGGAVGLLVAGIIAFIGHAYFIPESIITKEEVNKHGIYPSKPALESGFLAGDKVIAINGKDFEEYVELIDANVLRAGDLSYTIDRDGQKLEIRVKKVSENFIKSRQSFLLLRAPFEVYAVVPGSPADAAGILSGDRITQVNDQPVVKYTEMVNACSADDDGLVSLVLERTTKEGVGNLAVKLSMGDNGQIGITPRELIQYGERKNSLVEAIRKGTFRAFGLLKSNLYALYKILLGILVPDHSLSGPIATGHAYEENFWEVTGLYAMFFAFCNLLPVPMSAIWEIIPLGYEGLTKKRYPYSAFRKSRIIGWLITGVLIVWIFVGDVITFFL